MVGWLGHMLCWDWLGLPHDPPISNIQSLQYPILEFRLPNGSKFLLTGYFFSFFFVSEITSCPELHCVRNYIVSGITLLFLIFFFIIIIFFFVSGIMLCPELLFFLSGITLCPELRCVRNYVVSGNTLCVTHTCTHTQTHSVL